MEGYTDVAIAHQFGFRNAVAVLGTALGERHVKLLKRFADRVVLMLDGDEAGQRRTDEVLQLFVAENVDLRVLTLPDDLDPADFLLERGAEPFAVLMERCPDALEHKYRTLAARCGGMPTLHQTTEIAEAVLDVLAKSEAGLRNFSTDLSIRANAAVARLHTLTRIPEDKLRKSLAERRRKAAEGTPRDVKSEQTARPLEQDDASDGTRFMQAETWLMEILVHQPEHLQEVAGVLTSDHLRRSAHRAVFAAACHIHEQGGLPSFDALMLEFDDPQLKNLLISLDEARRGKNRAATVEEVRQLLGVLQERTPTGDWPGASRRKMLNNLIPTLYKGAPSCSTAATAAAQAQPPGHFRTHGRVRMPRLCGGRGRPKVSLNGGLERP
ncbi:MAG: toprim domain-containing protein [Pirellulales bacterium]